MAWMITRDLIGSNMEGRGVYAKDRLLTDCDRRFVIRDITGQVAYEGVSDEEVSVVELLKVRFIDSPAIEYWSANHA